MRNSIIVLFSGLVLLGCAAPTEAPATAISFDDFTTEGKPTKTVETPWGDKEVYDPTQDTEVIEAFEYVKRIHEQHGPDKKYGELKSYDILFTQIRDIQYYDMGRVGCKWVSRPTCGNEHIDFTQNTIQGNCPVPSWGAPTLDKCETENSTLVLNDEYPVQASLPEPQCYTAYFGYIGSKERETSLRGSKETVSRYFFSKCLDFAKSVKIYD